MFYLIKFADSQSHSAHNDVGVCWFLPLSFCFIFHVPCPQQLKGLGGFNPTKILQPNKVLKRSIINAFPCVVVSVLNLVLRHLRVLNFEFPLARHYIQSKFPKYWYKREKKLFVTSTPLVRKIILWYYTHNTLLAFSALAQLQMHHACIKLQRAKICLQCKYIVVTWVGLEEKFCVSISGSI